MKKYIFFTLHFCYFVTILLFLPPNITLYLSSILIAILALDNIFFTVLPLIIVLFIPQEYSYVLFGVFFLQIVLNPFIRKNRFYALSVFLLQIFTVSIFLYIFEGLKSINIELLLLSLIIYSIINILHIFQKNNEKYIIISYNQKLVYATLILGYFSILYLYNDDIYLIYFLFIQVFLLCDIKYNIIFWILFIALQSISKKFIIENILYSISLSFLPISISLILDYTNKISFFLLAYSLIANIIPWIKFKKNITIENDYINRLFEDFNKYINMLNKEFDKNEKIKLIKKNKILEYNNTYCIHCNKNTLCKTKTEKRYSFISSAMLGMNNNIYNCPYYDSFKLDINLGNINKSYEYSAIKSLAFELSYLYNQSLRQKNEYEKFINLLNTHGYNIDTLDINFSSSSIFFSMTLNSNKIIVNEIFLRCAFKAFGEELEMKNINNTLYFFKKTQIKITYAHTVLAKEGNLMSGDNYYIKKDYNNSYTFALSDGMGSGYNAYTESTDALKTISTLSSYHFSSKTILHLLEDIYEIKSNYDRYATLDYLSIDTANRKMKLYKMGSSTTYILHNNFLNVYDNKSLPLKLDESNSTYELDIFSGDYIFLLSDGIGDFITKEEFNSIVQNTTKTADELCYSIIEYIKEKEDNDLKDDLSLIVIKAI